MATTVTTPKIPALGAAAETTAAAAITITKIPAVGAAKTTTTATTKIPAVVEEHQHQQQEQTLFKRSAAGFDKVLFI